MGSVQGNGSSALPKICQILGQPTNNPPDPRDKPNQMELRARLVRYIPLLALMREPGAQLSRWEWAAAQSSSLFWAWASQDLSGVGMPRNANCCRQWEMPRISGVEPRVGKPRKGSIQGNSRPARKICQILDQPTINPPDPQDKPNQMGL